MYRLRLSLSHAQAQRLEALLELGEVRGVLWVERDAPVAWFDVFAEDREAAETDAATLADMFRRDPEMGVGEAPWAIEFVPDRDWQEAWKEHFHAEQVSDRIIVSPSWESVAAGEGVAVVRIDPGMSFGTGQHPTTRACLRAIDRLALQRPGASFCDVGCGSGILSIAAAKLGLQPVVAFDNDPVAVESAERNAVLNGVTGLVDVRALDLDDDGHGLRPCDVVVANMLAHLLERFASRIASLVVADDEARLILGGMLHDQFDAVTERFAASSLVVAETARDGDWVSAILRRGPSGAVRP